MAEANRNRVILEAEAEAEAIRVRGEAEAYAIEAKAKAEAEQMQKKAEAWKEYHEAAMIEMLLDSLPKVFFFLFITFVKKGAVKTTKKCQKIKNKNKFDILKCLREIRKDVRALKKENRALGNTIKKFLS